MEITTKKVLYKNILWIVYKINNYQIQFTPFGANGGKGPKLGIEVFKDMIKNGEIVCKNDNCIARI